MPSLVSFVLIYMLYSLSPLPPLISDGFDSGSSFLYYCCFSGYAHFYSHLLFSFSALLFSPSISSLHRFIACPVSFPVISTFVFLPHSAQHLCLSFLLHQNQYLHTLLYQSHKYLSPYPFFPLHPSLFHLHFSLTTTALLSLSLSFFPPTN